MKKISVLVPTYNEKDNIADFVSDIEQIFSDELHNYNYEIVIIDNNSNDGTKNIIEELCSKNSNIKAIFNIRNFGSIRSGFYGLLQTSGDCVVKIAADFQEPIDMIPKMVSAWEDGSHVVIGIKSSSAENKLKYKTRNLYYSIIKRCSEIEQIEGFTGFGLYDKSFIDTLRQLDDPLPYFRGLVSEYGGKRTEILYDQPARKNGESKYRLKALYDYAMLGFTSYTKSFLRSATFVSGLLFFVSLILTIILVVASFNAVSATNLLIIAAICCMFFISGIMTFFIGMLGEYVLSINTRTLNRPLVAEEKRINF